ncbi:MAG: DNA mismatch repair protein MutS [Bacteroidetes bacterium]|nr:MAG: DNA mismatch repair protein MutS [Bacteroidota bacterium]
MAFDDQTLRDLEFEQIRSWLSGAARGETAKSRLENLAPQEQAAKVIPDLYRLKEFCNILTVGEAFPQLFFHEIQAEIKLLQIKHAVLNSEGVLKILQASELTNRLLTFFSKRDRDYPLLSELVQNCYYTDVLVLAIKKVFDDQGEIRNDASEKLSEIRDGQKVLRHRINRNFDKVVRQLNKLGYLAETKETFINEKRVLTVLSTYKRQVSGSVLGSSKTGSLTFIEPEINLEANREMDSLIDEEKKEIYRILKLLTRELSEHLDLIIAYQQVLCELDFIQAKANLSMRLECELPHLSEDQEIELIQARHPILWRSNRDSGKKTEAQNITLHKFARMLVISGPNAGGKSITLKTVGLLQIMLQSGLLVPCDANSKMSFFQHVLTDIGDHQSIENELSTYSYRLRRMKHFLELSNRKTLLLLDEFGTGSDPELGGALAEVFFEELYNKKSYGVITTHYNNIKLKADRLKNAYNGCMLFDSDSLEPLFKFSPGQPGSSFTFEVAAANGIDPELIEEAKTKIDHSRVRMDQILTELQREKNYFEELNQAHREAQEEADEARRYFLAQRKKLQLNSERIQRKSAQEEKFIESGKILESYIQRFQLKKGKLKENQELLKELRAFLQREKEKQLSIQVKARAKKETSKKKQTTTQKQKSKQQQEKIKVGSTVRLISGKEKGIVEELSEKTVTVRFGFARMKVDLDQLQFIS